MEVPVIGGAARPAPSDLMVGSHQVMLSIMERVGLSFIPDDCPPVSELMETNEEGRPRYFYVHDAYRASVPGVVSKMGAYQFECSVRTSVEGMLKELDTVWPSGWAVVALAVEGAQRMRLQRRQKEDPARDMARSVIPASGEHVAETSDAHAKTVSAYVPEDDLVLHLVICDLSQRSLYDPLEEEKPGNKAGVFHTFANTGRLRDLPKVWRARRQKASEILEQWKLALVERDKKPAPSPESLRIAELEAQIARLSKSVDEVVVAEPPKPRAPRKGKGPAPSDTLDG